MPRLALAAVGPGPELLQDPCGLPGRRVGEPVAQRLRPCALLLGVAGFVLVIVLHCGQRTLLEGGQLVHRVGVGRDQRHVQVDAAAMRGFGHRDAAGHHRAPVPTLRHVAIVAQALHQLAPGAADAFDAPAPGGRLVGEAVARQCGAHDVEGILRLAAITGGVGERADDLQELDDRAWPAVRHHQWQRVGVRRADVQEMEAQAVDTGAELREGVEALRHALHVVLRGPVAAHLLHVRERYALAPVARGLGVRPACGGEAPAQVLDPGAPDLDLERDDGVRHVPVSVLPGFVFVPKPTRGRPGLSLQPCNLERDHMPGGPILASTPTSYALAALRDCNQP